MADNNYQVFISFKNTDENNKKTRDAEIARDLYDFLENQGVSVFFSEKSTLGSNYSETIDNALEQSQILFVIGTKTEYLNSKWVRREYETYFEIHEHPNIFTVTTGIKLPTSLARLQSFNPTSQSYNDDIVSICKKCGIIIDTDKYISDRVGNESEVFRNSVDQLVGECKMFSRKRLSQRKDNLLEQISILIKEKVNLESLRLDMNDFINYGCLLQGFLLPGVNNLRKKLPDLGVSLLYLPKDDIGGDFYWARQIGNVSYIICGDATGHGVPGVIMVSIALHLLESIEIDASITPSEILHTLSESLLDSVKGLKEGERLDRFDLSVVRINADSLEMQYAGAYLPVYIISKDSSDFIESENCRKHMHVDFPGINMAELKANRFDVSFKDDEARDFGRMAEIQLSKGDRICLFTDGIWDFFGGPTKKKKFGSINLRRALFQSAEFEPDKQLAHLETEINDWRGELEMIDDATVILLEV